MLIERYNEVKKHVEEACKRVGRDPREVTVIAVSKTKPLEMVEELRKEKVLDFGENKVQEIVQKAPRMPEDARFHMIGHLQHNKIRQVLPHIEMIHSVDSVRLAEYIEKEAQKEEREVKILLEVNVAKEESKFGFAPEEVEEAVLAISQMKHLKICGLMTIAPNVEHPEENRPVFKKLYELSVDIKKKNVDNVSMSVLSMGMTGDYEVAVEEGATMIRVGTGIFGAR